MRKTLLTTSLILGLTALPGLAQAEPIVGSIFLSGNNVRVFADAIDWWAVGGGTGTIPVTLATDYFDVGGHYAGGVTGEIDTLMDLSLAASPAGAPLADPIEGFQTISNTGLNFTLTRIGTCSEQVGVLCPDPLSPFGFVSQGNLTNVTMVMFGTVVDSTNPGFLSSWEGTFSANVPLSLEAIGAAFGPNGPGFVDASYAGTKIATDIPQEVPEPASMLLLGSGLVGLAAARRRKKA